MLINGMYISFNEFVIRYMYTENQANKKKSHVNINSRKKNDKKYYKKYNRDFLPG